jgi:FkbM family methyltransferase
MFLKIAKKLVHSVRGRRIAAMRGQPQWCKVPAGFWMYVDPNEYLGRVILLGYAASHLVYFIKQVIREGDVCVDVGANQGYIALHLARGVGSDGRVVAIEPTEPIFQRLQANIEYNRAHQVICVQSAAGDCVQTVDMWYNPAESILSSVHHRYSAQAIRVRVQQEPVDSILERLLTSTQLDKLILVKIDVEGYEPMVLKGLQQTLRRSKPLLWMEKDRNYLQEGGFTTLDIVNPFLGRVYISRAAELVRQSPETLQTLVLRTLKQLFLMAIAPTLLSAAAAPALFAWIFGSDWRPSGEYLQILSPMLLMNLLVFPLYHTLTVLNKSNLLLGIETLRIVLVFLSFWLPAVLGHSVRVALWAYSASYILTQLLLMGMIVKVSHSLLSRQVKYGGDEDRQDEDVNKDR